MKEKRAKNQRENVKKKHSTVETDNPACCDVIYRPTVGQSLVKIHTKTRTTIEEAESLPHT